MSIRPQPAAPGGWTAPPTFREQSAEGRALRDRIPRESLAQMPKGERDPLGILHEQESARIADLVPIRAERMVTSPFTFYRGTAALMAADLAASPHTDLLVGSCGDAHVSNFGLYASPQRTLVFDLNDFDEAAWAPWEWDVKRMVTSILIAGEASSRDDRIVTDAALGAVRTYAQSLANGAMRSPLDRYYDRFDAKAAAAADPASRKALREAIKAARKHTGTRAAHHFTATDAEGRVRFNDAPPTMTHLDDAIERRVAEVYGDYVASANIDIRLLLQKYVVSDVARRVVGVGSVGTRCYLLALQEGGGHTLLLQAKEAETSVLVRYGKVPQPPAVSRYIQERGDGARVVGMQRILQAVSDPFLGHVRGTPPEGGADRAFYLRQFNDMKGGLEMEELEDDAFRWYADACAAALARAHGQSPTAAIVVGYVGGGRTVGRAILDWSSAYVATSRADWELFRAQQGATRAAEATG